MTLHQNNKKISVALYARVSTEMQAVDGFSTDAQVETLTQHCKHQGYDIYNVYIDRGLSGSNVSKRPALLTMLEDAKQQKFDKIFVWKLSRLARNTRDLLGIVEDLQKYNIDFHSLSENFQINNSTGMFMMQMLSAVSEYEKNIIVDQVKLGQAQRAIQGFSNGARVLGYDKPRKPREPIKVNEYEAEIIKQIFNLYERGNGLRSIANTLNKQGRRTKRDNAFSTDAVKRILNNPLYAGKIRFNQYVDWEKKRRKGKNDTPILVDGKHEAIIDKDQWKNVQERMKQRSFTPKVVGDGSNLLTGILKCPQCGSAMMASTTTNTLKGGTKKRIRYYSCQMFRSKGASVCSANSIRADDIEAKVQEQILKLLNQPSVLKEVVKETNERIRQTQTSLNKQHPKLEEDIVELSNQVVRLQEASKADNEVKTILEPRIQEISMELQKKKSQLLKLKENTGTSTEISDIYHEEELEKVLYKLQEEFTHQNKMKIKQMYLVLIDKITFEKEKGKRTIDNFTIYLKKDVGTILLENMNLSEASKNEASLSLCSEGIIIDYLENK